MNWAKHPNLYQVLHPWHWLTYGANSSALAAAATLLAAIAAAFAGYFALKTYRSAQRQLDVATKQYWDSHKAYLESVRPHLIVRTLGLRPSEILAATFIPVKVRNVGSGRAINIEGRGGIAFTAFSLAAGVESDATVELLNTALWGIGSRNFFLYYSSVDGRRFRSETTIRDYAHILNEEELDISAGIEPDSFEDVQSRRRLN
jgi:hypothetical protein